MNDKFGCMEFDERAELIEELVDKITAAFTSISEEAVRLDRVEKGRYSPPESEAPSETTPPRKRQAPVPGEEPKPVDGRAPAVLNFAFLVTKASAGASLKSFYLTSRDWRSFHRDAVLLTVEMRAAFWASDSYEKAYPAIGAALNGLGGLLDLLCLHLGEHTAFTWYLIAHRYAVAAQPAALALRGYLKSWEGHLDQKQYALMWSGLDEVLEGCGPIEGLYIDEICDDELLQSRRDKLCALLMKIQRRLELFLCRVRALTCSSYAEPPMQKALMARAGYIAYFVAQALRALSRVRIQSKSKAERLQISWRSLQAQAGILRNAIVCYFDQQLCPPIDRCEHVIESLLDYTRQGLQSALTVCGDCFDCGFIKTQTELIEKAQTQVTVIHRKAQALQGFPMDVFSAFWMEFIIIRQIVDPCEEEEDECDETKDLIACLFETMNRLREKAAGHDCGYLIEKKGKKRVCCTDEKVTADCGRPIAGLGELWAQNEAIAQDFGKVASGKMRDVAKGLAREAEIGRAMARDLDPQRAKNKAKAFLARVKSAALVAEKHATTSTAVQIARLDASLRDAERRLNNLYGMAS